MATYVPAKVSTQFIFYVSLVSQANTKLFQVNPTIASGDFKVSIDGGALANLGTLPTVTPAGGTMVKITLSTSEMAGANATVQCIDAAGAEWCDLSINIPTSARQVDDLAFPATTGRSMVVDAAGLVDANTVKIGATGAGTAQTARDLGTSVLLSSGTGTGQVKLSSGYVAPNWGDVGNPTTSLALTGTTIATTQKVDVETIKTQAVTAAAGVTFPTSIASPTNITAGTITTATNLTNAPGAGDFTATMKSSIGTAVAASAVASVTGNVGGNVTGSVGSVVGAVGSVTGAVGSVTGAVGSVTGAVGSVTGAVGSVTGNVGGNVVGSVATVTDLSATAQTELSAVPTSTATIKDMIKWNFLLSRNKLTQTATTTLVKANDGSTTVATSTVSDDATTATRGVFS